MSERAAHLNIGDAEKDEHVLELIGGAMLSLWWKLPKDLKEEILSTAERLVYLRAIPPTDEVRTRFGALVKKNSG